MAPLIFCTGTSRFAEDCRTQIADLDRHHEDADAVLRQATNLTRRRKLSYYLVMFCGGTAVTSRLRGYVVIGALLGWTLVPLDAQQGRPFFYTEAGYVVASGDWKDSSGKPVDDTATSGHSIEIQCRQEIKECFEAKAMLVAGKPVASISNYRIIEWDKNSIVAEDDSAICVVGRLLITFQDRSVTAIDTPKKGAKGMTLGNGKNACELVNRTQTYTLVSRLGAAR